MSIQRICNIMHIFTAASCDSSKQTENSKTTCLFRLFRLFRLERTIICSTSIYFSGNGRAAPPEHEQAPSFATVWSHAISWCEQLAHTSYNKCTSRFDDIPNDLLVIMQISHWFSVPRAIAAFDTSGYAPLSPGTLTGSWCVSVGKRQAIGCQRAAA